MLLTFALSQNKVLQVDILIYLGCLVSYEVEENINLIVVGLIHVFQLLLNGNEIWIMKAKDKSRLTATKIKYVRLQLITFLVKTCIIIFVAAHI